MEFITIEQRPRIQSCNVFMSTKHSTESREIKLSLKNNSIGLKIFNNCFDIDLQSLMVIPESLSSLSITDKWISFRLQSSPVDSKVGTFSTEVIDSQKLEREISIATEMPEIQLPPKNTQLSLVCNCCKNILTKSDIIFERVLPLPSDDCDPSQWFCCSHTGDDLNIKTLLQPRDKDFFYGSHYCILNRNIFLDKYKVFGEDVVCNRCLTVLGNDDSNFGNAIKFWNCSLQFTVESLPSIYSNQTSPWIDFKAAFLHCISDDIFNSEINFLAVEQNRQYLLIIKPMEKNLCLLTESLSSKSNKITLDKKLVTKVLYRYEKSQCSVKNKNSDVRICRISVRSITAGIDNLVLSSQRIASIYRKIEPDYHVGYIL
ncbi:uncharacterized protein LOC135164460 [Diachasmimorpha longicaudata]|uniref:uncharacterized protein LOC135164460 n=1 Tax=Diachasmimorpha longicaudata TaxID=58733 RepID=UPI0030B8AC30